MLKFLEQQVQERADRSYARFLDLLDEYYERQASAPSSALYNGNPRRAWEVEQSLRAWSSISLSRLDVAAASSNSKEFTRLVAEWQQLLQSIGMSASGGGYHRLRDMCEADLKFLETQARRIVPPMHFYFKQWSLKMQQRFAESCNGINVRRIRQGL